MSNDLSLVFIKGIISKIVRETGDGNQKIVNPESSNFRKLKNIVRYESEWVERIVEVCADVVKRYNCAERQILLSLIDYFFVRSNVFRVQVIERLHDLLKYLCETDPQYYPLPGPTNIAKELKVCAIKTIKMWHEKFAAGYIKLDLVAEFLRSSKALNYDEVSADLAVEQQMREEKRLKKERGDALVVEAVRSRWDRLKDGISVCLREVDTALRILVPFMGDSQEANDQTREPPSQRQKLHGYVMSDSMTVHISIASINPVVVVSDENDALVQAVIDGSAVLRSHLRNVEKYLKKLTGVSSSSADLIQDLLQYKHRLEGMKAKIEEVKFEGKTGRRKKTSRQGDSESESDWEDVQEKNLEDFVQPDDIPDYIMRKIDNTYVDQPCCSKTVLAEDEAKEKERKEKQDQQQKPKVPVVPFGLDLKYWGEKLPTVQIQKNNADCHRFWRQPVDEESVEERESVYQTRVITFVGEERRSDKICKARLPSGNICPRRDFVKCPLHGTIVDRDDEGFPVEEMSSELADEKMQIDDESARKESAEYIRDLELQTGISFEGKQKRKRKLNVPVNTTRKRLEKKLLDPKTVKRVSAVMDATRKAKIEKKFGQQYAHI